MSTRVAAMLLLTGALLPMNATAQTSPNPTQQLDTARQDQVPVFRVTVVGRSIPAINYRPRKGETTIDFAGTALLPRSKGTAKIEGQKGYIHIDARFNDLEPPTHFGPEYLTYVLWAITPEGRAKNLGEVQYDDDDARVQVTTDLQAFGLIVTAEPYFAVTQPSDAVVIENVVRNNTKGALDVVQAKYDLLKRGTYLMNHDFAQLKVKALEPGAPLDLAEARNAIALARLADADRYAGDTFAKAARLLAEAEDAREHHKKGNEVMMPSRQAVQTAEDARLIALERREQEYQAQQRETALRREAAALDRAHAEETARLQAEAAKANAERDRATAEAARLAAEAQAQRDREAAQAARIAVEAQAQRDREAADAARLAAEADAQQARDLAARTEREKADAEASRAAAESARAAAEAARLAAENQAQQAQATAAQLDRERAELRNQLREQLNLILETRETARGLIVNLSDVLFDTDSATLKPGAREKLAKVAGVLLSHPGLHIEVEGHADSTGAASYNQELSENRANSVRDYMVRQGIPPNTVATAGFGESRPVVSNNTAAGRQQNRRVELIVSGEAIGTLTDAQPAR